MSLSGACRAFQQAGRTCRDEVSKGRNFTVIVLGRSFRNPNLRLMAGAKYYVPVATSLCHEAVGRDLLLMRIATVGEDLTRQARGNNTFRLAPSSIFQEGWSYLPCLAMLLPDWYTSGCACTI